MPDIFSKRFLDKQIDLPLEDKNYTCKEVKQILNFVLDHLEQVLKEGV